MPNLLVIKVENSIRMETIKAGSILAGPVLFLCSASPLPYLILVPFERIKAAISLILILAISCIKTIAKSFPPPISIKQLISVVLYGTNYIIK